MQLKGKTVDDSTIQNLRPHARVLVKVIANTERLFGPPLGGHPKPAIGGHLKSG